MISNNCNNFSVDGGMPLKNGQYTTHHARSASYAHDAVYHQFFGGYTHVHVPPSIEKLLRSFLNQHKNSCSTDIYSASFKNPTI